MGVLIQPLVSARASGGGLSETAEGQMLISRHLGPRLGDRAGRGGARPHRAQPITASCARSRPAAKAIATPARTASRRRELVPKDLVSEPCLTPGEAVTLGRLLRKCEELAGSRRSRSNGRWTRAASSCCSRGRCMSSRRSCRTKSGCSIPASTAIPPASAGARAAPWWSTANANCRASRPATFWSPALRGRRSATSCRASAGVVAELGGSTSHLASLARERGIPMVLGVLDATRKIPDGAQCRGRRRRRHRAVAAVSGKAAHLRHASRSPSSALKRLRALAQRQDLSRRQPDHPQATLIAAVRKADILFCLLHDKIDRAVHRRQSEAARTSRRNRSRPSISTSRKRPSAAFRSRWCRRSTTEATADLNFGLMLAVARRMIEGDRLVRAGKFPGGQSRASARRLRLRQDHRPDRRRRPDRQGGGAARARLLHARALLDAAAQAGKRGARGRA